MRSSGRAQGAFHSLSAPAQLGGQPGSQPGSQLGMGLPSRRRILASGLCLLMLFHTIRLFAAGVASLASEPRVVARAVRVDLNRARIPELLLLPGIGPERAEQIVLERVRNGPFDSVRALERVVGIGPETVSGLRPFVTVGR